MRPQKSLRKEKTRDGTKASKQNKIGFLVDQFGTGWIRVIVQIFLAKVCAMISTLFVLCTRFLELRCLFHSRLCDQLYKLLCFPFIPSASRATRI